MWETLIGCQEPLRQHEKKVKKNRNEKLDSAKITGKKFEWLRKETIQVRWMFGCFR